MANGQQLSEKNFLAFDAWICRQSDESFREIAVRGALSRKRIASQCGFGDSALSQNPRIKARLVLLENELRARGVLTERVVMPMDSSCRSKELDDDASLAGVVSLGRLQLENKKLTDENKRLKTDINRLSLLREALFLTGRMPR